MKRGSNPNPKTIKIQAEHTDSDERLKSSVV